MYTALGEFDGGDGYTDLSFRDLQRWSSRTKAQQSSRVAGTALHTSAVLFGDEATGPVLLLLALGPGVHPPDAPAHRHASDSWRMPVLGTLPMRPDSYDPGDFTFREGWKPYASDNYAHGPDGGWTALLFGDRRGIRVRHVKQEGPEITETDRLLAEWLGVAGDLVSTDPADAPGPSSMVTTLDDLRRGARLNASFHDTSRWTSFDGIEAMAGAVGERTSGPIVLLSKIAPGRPPLGGVVFDSDVLRLVARGSYDLEGRTYQAGDMRVQAAGVPLGEPVAGAGGVDEVVVVADRRSVQPASTADPAWAATLDALLGDVQTRLSEA